MKRLAIIPARSGSKRLKNKNFKLLGGKPLINYTVENLIKSKLFETIHVSSDKNLKNILSKYKKIDYFLRPKNISGDKTILNKVIKWVLKEYLKKGKKFDVVCLAYATSPLISHKDFILACKSFEKTNLKIPMLSVAEFKPSIDEALKFKNNKLTPVYKNNFFKDSKEHKKFYYDTASFVFFSSKYFEKERREKKFLKYKLDRFKGIDLNDLKDFKLIELIYKNNK